MVVVVNNDVIGAVGMPGAVPALMVGVVVVVSGVDSPGEGCVLGVGAGGVLGVDAGAMLGVGAEADVPVFVCGGGAGAGVGWASSHVVNPVGHSQVGVPHTC